MAYLQKPVWGRGRYDQESLAAFSEDVQEQRPSGTAYRLYGVPDNGEQPDGTIKRHDAANLRSVVCVHACRKQVQLRTGPRSPDAAVCGWSCPR